VQRGIPVRSRRQKVGGVEQAVQLAEGLSHTPGQFRPCGLAGPVSQRGLVQQLPRARPPGAQDQVLRQLADNPE
jgi:hypothetical protein